MSILLATGRDVELDIFYTYGRYFVSVYARLKLSISFNLSFLFKVPF